MNFLIYVACCPSFRNTLRGVKHQVVAVQSPTSNLGVNQSATTDNNNKFGLLENGNNGNQLDGNNSRIATDGEQLGLLFADRCHEHADRVQLTTIKCQVVAGSVYNEENV